MAGGKEQGTERSGPLQVGNVHISPSALTDSEIRFAARAARRGRLFLMLSVAGVAIALALAVFYGYRRWTDPGFPVGPRAVIVLLILLNARQNLRQYRYATLLRKLGDFGDPGFSARRA